MFYIFIFTLIFFAIGIFLSRNTISSVINMILTFLNGSLLLFFLDMDFLSVLILLIYATGISILFLFVIMMITNKNLSSIVFENTLFFTIVITFFFLQIYFYLSDIFLMKPLTTIYFINIDTISNIFIIGQLLYNYYNFLFLIIGLILLVAVIGPISLTFNFSTKQILEFDFKQISRSANALIFFRNIRFN
jgi:NADH-quinone oxidoreductase subunit J